MCQRSLRAVYRPALVTGDSRSGAANPDDFLSRGIGACIRMGCAPDLDWSIDACPVDHVARGVVRFAASQSGNNGDVLHFQHPRPRHWRELVLWMRLRGYPVRLVSYRDWLRQLEHTAGAAEHPLHALLGFFRARVKGLTLPETYLGSRRSRVNDEWTRATMTGLGVTCPTLDALWLERFFASLTTHGLISPILGNGRQAREASRDASTDELPALMRLYFDDPELLVRPAGPAERLSEQSILTELTSWQHGAALGLFRQPIELISSRESVPRLLQVVVKIKTEDQNLLNVIVAAVGDRAIAEAFDRWRGCLGFAGGHLREIALYGQRDDRWHRFTPIAYGAMWDEERRRGLIVLEDLSENTWMDSGTGTDIWPAAWVEAAVRGLAELHSIWFERRAELSAQPWLGSVFSAARMGEMAELWAALAAHAARFFVPWLGSEARHVQHRLLSRLEDWWRPLEQMPHTLIHNDCNPRNLAIRRDESGPRLCAFDWELATSAVPQHDLAELLCFVLPINCSRQTVQHYLDLHRNALEAATNCRISADDWNHGFGLALADLFINRWAMYTLVHSVRRQPFLERVLHTWRTLYAYYDPLK